MKKIFFYICLLSLGGLTLQSCDKYLDIQPVGTVVPKTIEDFRALITRGYSGFPAHKSLLTLRTDELVVDEYSQDIASIKDLHLWNDVNPDPTTLPMPWEALYKSIFYANHIIDNIDKEVGTTTEAKQVKAEAYALRAYAHFEALNMYADTYSPANADKRGVPLSLHLDLEQKFVPATIGKTYDQIFADVQEAENLMQLAEQGELVKYRFSKRSLLAFKAHIYIYRAEWDKALTAAEGALAINSTLEDLNQASSLLPSDFKSKEMVLSLEKSALPTVLNSSFISDDLLGSYDRANDQRFARYFQKKGGDYVSLKGGDNQFNVSLRNADLYLMKAEAQAHLNKLTDAKATLALLLQKRLKPAYYTTQVNAIASLDADAFITYLFNERKREFALEGVRWYDLKRSTRPQITHYFFGKSYVLQANDPRYVIRYPKAALENNPDLQ